MARFTLAINRRDKDGNNAADYVPVVAFGKTAELCMRYLSKGSKAGIEGSIRTGSYTAQDGSTRYTTEVYARSVEFLTRRDEAGRNDNNVSAVDPDRFVEVDDEKLPWE